MKLTKKSGAKMAMTAAALIISGKPWPMPSTAQRLTR
jgi:hypothetical protein